MWLSPEDENVEYTYTLREMYNFYKNELGWDENKKVVDISSVNSCLVVIYNKKALCDS